MDLKTLTLSKVQEMYLDRVNNFLTDERFAEYYNLNIVEAKVLIEKCTEIQEIYSNLYRELRCLNNLK